MSSSTENSKLKTENSQLPAAMVENLDGADPLSTVAAMKRELRSFAYRVHAMLSPGRGCLSQNLPIVSAGVALSRVRRIVTVDGAEHRLTARQYDLLFLLISNPGRDWSRQELLRRVWGLSYFGSPRCVDVCVSRLRRLLGAAGEHIRTQYGAGYRWQVAPENRAEESESEAQPCQ